MHALVKHTWPSLPSTASSRKTHHHHPSLRYCSPIHTHTPTPTHSHKTVYRAAESLYASSVHQRRVRSGSVRTTDANPPAHTDDGHLCRGVSNESANTQWIFPHFPLNIGRTFLSTLLLFLCVCACCAVCCVSRRVAFNGNGNTYIMYLPTSEKAPPLRTRTDTDELSASLCRRGVMCAAQRPSIRPYGQNTWPNSSRAFHRATHPLYAPYTTILSPFFLCVCSHRAMQPGSTVFCLPVFYSYIWTRSLFFSLLGFP